MTDTPQLTHKKVVCFGCELSWKLKELEDAGYRVSVIDVKGTCEWHLTAYLDWLDSRGTKE